MDTSVKFTIFVATFTFFGAFLLLYLNKPSTSSNQLFRQINNACDVSRNGGFSSIPLYIDGNLSFDANMVCYNGKCQPTTCTFEKYSLSARNTFVCNFSTSITTSVICYR